MQDNNKRLKDCFESTEKVSIKNSSYFNSYEFMFEKYRDKPIIFCEVGVFNGGSLQMWRDYFGPKARIVGIDLNPIALELEKDGFEIYIGDQESKAFWSKLKEEIGFVDVILDDGGHKNGQQISTLFYGVDLIRDGGILVIEDTHTSYFRRFGNPSPYSFINFSKKIIDDINSRFQFVKSSDSKFMKCVWSVIHFESVVAFYIDRSKCFVGEPVTNGGKNIGAVDFRNYQSASSRLFLIEEKINGLVAHSLLKKIISKIFDINIYMYEFISNLKLAKFYRK